MTIPLVFDGIKPGQAEPQEPYAAPTKTENKPAQGGTV